MRIFYFWIILCLSLSAAAQEGILEVVSSTGKAFVLRINNMPANTSPETTVRLTQVPKGVHQLELVFSPFQTDTLRYEVFVRENMEHIVEVVSDEGTASNPYVVQEYSKSISSINNKVENETETTDSPQTSPQPVSNNCETAMSIPEFSGLKTTLLAIDDDKTRLAIAQQVAATNCLDVDQVKTIILFMKSEDSRFEFAVHAYSYVHDPENYWKIAAILSEESAQVLFQSIMK